MFMFCHCSSKIASKWSHPFLAHLGKAWGRSVTPSLQICCPMHFPKLSAFPMLPSAGSKYRWVARGPGGLIQEPLRSVGHHQFVVLQVQWLLEIQGVETGGLTWKFFGGQRLPLVQKKSKRSWENTENKFMIHVWKRLIFMEVVNRRPRMINRKYHEIHFTDLDSS